VPPPTWPESSTLGATRPYQGRRSGAVSSGRSIRYEPREETFKRHFAHGDDVLLEDWCASVVANGIDVLASLPPHLRFVLGERVIRMIRDRNIRPIERIQAIREMRRAGYVAGANALIALPGADETIPSEEIVSSLEAISGLALGLDKPLWLDWFDQPPEEAVRVADRVRDS
jgi:hypothetical protein